MSRYLRFSMPPGTADSAMEDRLARDLAIIRSTDRLRCAAYEVVDDDDGRHLFAALEPVDGH